MNAIIAQRLVRKLCDHCKQAQEATEQDKILLEVPQDTTQVLYHAVGCALCQGVGYRGRLGLFETLWFDGALSKLVSKGCSEETLELEAGPRLRQMWFDGIDKVRQGITTLEEVQKVTIKRALNG